jgi:hypothetical protein
MWFVARFLDDPSSTSLLIHIANFTCEDYARMFFENILLFTAKIDILKGSAKGGNLRKKGVKSHF